MVRALLTVLVPPVLPKQMLWQPQQFAGESCDLVCCLKACSWNQMINWDSWLLLKNNPFLVWDRKWKWMQPHLWKATKWVDHHCYVVAHIVNLMDSLPVVWYLESHLLVWNMWEWQHLSIQISSPCWVNPRRTAAFQASLGERAVLGASSKANRWSD